MSRYLYRGVNSELDVRNGGVLLPNTPRKPFRSHAYWGDAHWNDGSVYGEAEANIVVQHQRDSSKYESSGVSTTPILENAERYATHDGKYSEGVVYVIDRELLEQHGVKAYEVGDYATQPAIPGDKEVILVASDFNALPAEIIVEKRKLIRDR